MAQNRKRAILLAAAPHCPLPHFPAVMHVFEQMPLNINVDEKCFDVNAKHWRNNSAPYRNMTALDAISDLPRLDMPKSKQMASDPVTWYQRMVKWNGEGKKFHSRITHHEAKQCTEIVMARIAHIPKVLGSDWRDLPNIQVTLPSGRQIKKLKYPYKDIKTGRPAVCFCNTSIRGVSCLSKNF